jgi:xanthine dehydrogenase small subunit
MPAVRRQLRFLLNDRPIVLDACRADETLLDFLRLRHALTGTKEGCAEGDCGACTVLVGRPGPEGGTGSGMAYEAVNACIRFVASLDGCHVVTVEHLASPDGTLHPVQAAMVEHHGSQCGFCTPGFVMSLHALWEKAERPTDAEIEKAVQGNLCRCTGYEAILRAARAASGFGRPAGSGFPGEAGVAAQLREWAAEGGRVEMGDGDGRFLVPADADDLAEILEAEPEARIVAGASDVGLWVTKGMRPIAPAVFIGHLRDLKGVAITGESVRIGANTTYTEAFAALAKRLPALGALIDRIGGDQIRNVGTVGGNIANGSPIGDMAPALIALGATLVLRKGQARRRLPLERFFLAYGSQDRSPGEFVEAVEFPLPREDALFAVHKVTKRRDEDITAVLGAFHLRVENGGVAEARIAYGGMAGTPKRAAAVEAALTGKPWTDATVAAALERFEADFVPLSDMRASAAYRMLVAKNLLRRFWLETAGDVALTRVRRHEAA